jgi:chromosome segregation ATPase
MADGVTCDDPAAMTCHVMAKNKPEGSRSRTARYRAALAARGIKPVQVLAPEAAHGLIRQAAGLMTRDDDPVEPRAALRQAGGANEPDEAQASPELRAELETAKFQIKQAVEARQVEIEAAEHQRKALEAERDAARALEAAEREKAQVTAAEAQTAARDAAMAQERVVEALDRAKKAEAAIRQARSLPGLKGRLVRWLAGEVLE